MIARSEEFRNSVGRVISVLKDGTPAQVTAALEQCFADAGGSYYATCAGCEIPRGTPPANLRAMRDFARAHRE